MDTANTAKAFSRGVDDALHEVGDFGYFQRCTQVLPCLIWAVTGMNTFCHVFVSPPPIRVCTTTPLGRVCHAGDQNDSELGLLHVFDSPWSSIVSTFDLEGEWQVWVAMLGTLFFVGFLLGKMVFNYLADQRGRRFALLGAIWILPIPMFATPLAPTLYVYALCRFLTGFFTGGACLTSLVWRMETCGGSWRAWANSSVFVVWIIGNILVAGLGKLLQNWRELHWAIFVAGLSLPVSAWHLVETPKWLASQGRLDEADHILRSMAESNGYPTPEPLPPDAADVSVGHGSCTELLTQPMLRHLVISTLAFCGANFGMYGIGLNAGHLGGDVYMNSLLMYVVALPAVYSIGHVIEIQTLGRRNTLALCFFLGAVSCGSSALISNPTAQAILAVVGMAPMCCAFCICFIYTQELFVTSARATGFGISCGVGHLGGIFAAMTLAIKDVVLTMMLFTMTMLLSGVAVLFLPETRGRPLADSHSELWHTVKTTSTCAIMSETAYQNVASA